MDYLQNYHDISIRLIFVEFREAKVATNKEWEKYFEQGNIAFEQGQYEQAETMLKAALSTSERGQDELVTATSLDRLGELYFEMQQYDQAEPLFKRALGIRERLLKPHDDMVVASLNNLSALYFFQGKHDQAEAPCKKLCEVYEAVLGKDHAEVATSVNNLALIY
ncbi:MAG TPA: tetratricopeptide repeat protein, partial [Candidatus Obscuribacter sp.]|nr:tetratricopeptide repeat protein [Candidatus Obscuribacter sp.]